MKKMIIGLFCVCFLVSGCTFSSTKEEDKPQRIDIGVEDAVVKFDKKDSFVALVTREKCSFCEQLLKVIDENSSFLSEDVYNIVMRDDTTEHLKQDVKTLQAYVTKPEETPHYYRIENGKVIDSGKGFHPGFPLQFFDWLDASKQSD